MNLPRVDQPFVIGTLRTPVGQVPRVSTELTATDRWGTFKARWGVGRMKYAVDPGLYAVGDPAADSPVVVTANYKMSFDFLRRELTGRNVWLLVLDTQGINVWCAAGKGTFGTDELVGRIAGCRLAEVVSHREIILPQLAAPGVAAHQVKKRSGFRVMYGPVRSRDLPAFIDAGCEATDEMRKKNFPILDRVVLIPVELVEAIKPAALIALFFFLLGGLGGPGTFWSNALDFGLFAVVALVSAVLAGAVMTPVLLPWLPGRAFSVKGCTIGIAVALVLVLFRSGGWHQWPGRLEMAAWLLIVPALTAYLAMNFTGASTYTSLSGVKKEMRFALPSEIAAAVVGVALWLGSRFTY